jgi:16S rRNA A1518/A1519 N6-dimethyltransferase RsmA/KsgA/DIM1 with predicted DNA glycosylase/AP lyase activity
MAVENLEQYFLNISDNTEVELKKLFHESLLNHTNILEFGAGTGKFTKLYSNEDRYIIALEIDKNLRTEFEKNNDFQSAIFLDADIKEFDIPADIDKIAIVSAPPYSLLEYINNTFIKAYKLPYILMVGERYLKLFDDYKIIYTLNEEDFEPISERKHYIITNIKD